MAWVRNGIAKNMGDVADEWTRERSAAEYGQKRTFQQCEETWVFVHQSCPAQFALSLLAPGAKLSASQT
jgi:hypothetical protein